MSNWKPAAEWRGQGGALPPEHMRGYVQASRQACWSEANMLVKQLRAEGRTPRASEQRDLDRFSKELDEFDRLLDDMQREETELNEARGDMWNLLHPDGPDRSGSEFGRIDQGLAALLNGTARSMELDLRNLRTVVDSKSGTWEIKNVQTTSSASELVPTSFHRRLLEHLVEASAIRQTNVDVIRTPSGERLVLPRSTAQSGASIVSEGSAIPELDPAFGQATLDAYKYGALTQVSFELLSDQGIVGPDLEDYLARQFAESVANASGEHFVTGDGSDKPTGFLTGGSVTTTSGTLTNGRADVTDILEVFYDLPGRYRRNAWWVMSDTAARELHKLEDGDGRPLWTPSLSSDRADQLLGKPVVIDPGMPESGTAATSIAFGDFSRAYSIRDAGVIRIEASRDFAFDKDITTFRVLGRHDGTPRDPNALRVYVGGTAT